MAHVDVDIVDSMEFLVVAMDRFRALSATDRNRVGIEYDRRRFAVRAVNSTEYYDFCAAIMNEEVDRVLGVDCIGAVMAGHADEYEEAMKAQEIMDGLGVTEIPA